MQSLLGPTLVRKSGASVPLAEALAGKKFVAVYFSAHWCPPCRAFTPVLSKFFTENADKLGLALVFVWRKGIDAVLFVHGKLQHVVCSCGSIAE